jgi:hypothetical protein
MQARKRRGFRAGIITTSPIGVGEIDIMIVVKLGRVSNSILVLDNRQPNVSSWLEADVVRVTPESPLFPRKRT